MCPAEQSLVGVSRHLLIQGNCGNQFMETDSATSRFLYIDREIHMYISISPTRVSECTCVCIYVYIYMCLLAYVST